jgi:hypothetical protein
VLDWKSFFQFYKRTPRSLVTYICWTLESKYYTIIFNHPEEIKINKITIKTYCQETMYLFEKYIEVLKLTGEKFDLTRDEEGNPTITKVESFKLKKNKARVELMRILNEWEYWFHRVITIDSYNILSNTIIPSASELMLKCKSDLIIHDCRGIEREFKEKLIQLFTLQLDWAGAYIKSPEYNLLADSFKSEETETLSEANPFLNSGHHKTILSYKWLNPNKTSLVQFYELIIESGLISKPTEEFNSYEDFQKIFNGKPISGINPIRWESGLISELLYFILQLRDNILIPGINEDMDYILLTTCFVKSDGTKYDSDKFASQKIEIENNTGKKRKQKVDPFKVLPISCTTFSFS